MGTKYTGEGVYLNEITEKLMKIIMLGNRDLEFEKINISDVLEEIISGAKDVFKEIRIEAKIHEKVYVKADRELLKALIMNLIKNSSVAYEGKRGVVKIELSKDADIRVIDYAKGMSNQELEKVKMPFYTLSKSRNRAKSGLGLGIPLCMKITEALRR